MRARLIFLLLSGLGVVLFVQQAQACQIIATSQARCPSCGEWVQVQIIQFTSGGSECYKNQGQTIPCCGDSYVFTSSPAGTCDDARNVCDWWVSHPARRAKAGQRLNFARKLFLPACDGSWLVVLDAAEKLRRAS